MKEAANWGGLGRVGAFGVFDEEVAAPLARELATLRKEVAALEAQIKQLGGGGADLAARRCW